MEQDSAALNWQSTQQVIYFVILYAQVNKF